MAEGGGVCVFSEPVTCGVWPREEVSVFLVNQLPVEYSRGRRCLCFY